MFHETKWRSPSGAELFGFSPIQQLVNQACNLGCIELPGELLFGLEGNQYAVSVNRDGTVVDNANRLLLDRALLRGQLRSAQYFATDSGETVDFEIVPSLCAGPGVCAAKEKVSATSIFPSVELEVIGELLSVRTAGPADKGCVEAMRPFVLPILYNRAPSRTEWPCYKVLSAASYSDISFDDLRDGAECLLVALNVEGEAVEAPIWALNGAAAPMTTIVTPDKRASETGGDVTRLVIDSNVLLAFDGWDGEFVFRLCQHHTGPDNAALSGDLIFSCLVASALAETEGADYIVYARKGGDGYWYPRESLHRDRLAATNYARLMERCTYNLTTVFIDGIPIADRDSQACFALALAFAVTRRRAPQDGRAQKYSAAFHYTALCHLIDAGIVAPDETRSYLVGTGEGPDGRVAKASSNYPPRFTFKRRTYQCKNREDVLQTGVLLGEAFVIGFDRFAKDSQPGQPDHYMVGVVEDNTPYVLYDPAEFYYGLSAGTELNVIGRDCRIVRLHDVEVGNA